eukprot:TRINITY_DN779_c0_g1_i2.p1 TRINITY_DN779_c0_g1~~TRINITY_DN779_c0_g1_i2.p1  ORF type:complete len:154 (-),score=10.20 TRINITY_DN779_c0_g1_i2:329-790(-)
MKIFSLLLLCAACKTQALTQAKQAEELHSLHLRSRPRKEYLNMKPFPRKRLVRMLASMNAVAERGENKEALNALKAETLGLTGKALYHFKLRRGRKAISAMFKDCLRTYGYVLGGEYIFILEKADWYGRMPGEEGMAIKAAYNKLLQSLDGLL